MLLSYRQFGSDDASDPVTVPLKQACPILECTPEELIDLALSNDPDSPHLVCVVTDGRKIEVQRSWLDAVRPEAHT
jgi:hypothetical protein